MYNISINPLLKEKCPALLLGCFSCKLRYEPVSELLDKEIRSACNEIQNDMQVPQISQLPAIASSRKAYKALGKDPARYRLSAEALLRRVVKGKGLYKINNIVDTLNLISIRTGYSICGYDATKIEGDILLGAGRKDEPYDAIGRGTLNIENLPVFRDNSGAFGTPTSDSTRTMITESTSDFLMIIMNFGGHDDLEKVLQQTKSLYQKYAAAEDIEIGII